MMSKLSSVYLLKAVRQNHSGSPYLESLIKACRRAVIEQHLGSDNLDLILESLSTLDDEAFSLAINGLRVLKEPADTEPQAVDITYEILKAKYGGKQ